ncbi:MAG: hypothetical protein M1533_06490 [Candidatus Thermoplasmatota archaeon]|nr:hypothetical protein [Candidatus Thermoplasmatota archaeon]
MGSTPNSSNPLAADSAKEILNKGRELGFKLAAFTGGEPTLALDNLITLIKHAKSLGYITRVVSNGWWAREEDGASLMLTKLKTAGLDEINMSFDDFHLDLPKGRWKAEQRNLINVAKASSSLGMKFGIGIIKKKKSVVNKEFVVNYLSEELGISKDDVLNKFAFIEDVAARTGRGRQTIADKDIEEREFPITGCVDIGSVYGIHPTGRITACCGHAMFDSDAFDVSNWKVDQDPLKRATEITGKNLVYWWLWALGPQKILRKLGVDVKTSHICDACELLTTRYRNEMLGYFRDHKSDILVNDVLLNPRARETVIMARNKGLL